MKRIYLIPLFWACFFAFVAGEGKAEFPATQKQALSDILLKTYIARRGNITKEIKPTVTTRIESMVNSVDGLNVKDEELNQWIGDSLVYFVSTEPDILTDVDGNSYRLYVDSLNRIRTRIKDLDVNYVNSIKKRREYRQGLQKVFFEKFNNLIMAKLTSGKSLSLAFRKPIYKDGIYFNLPGVLHALNYQVVLPAAGVERRDIANTTDETIIFLNLLRDLKGNFETVKTVSDFYYSNIFSEAYVREEPATTEKNFDEISDEVNGIVSEAIKEDKTVPGGLIVDYQSFIQIPIKVNPLRWGKKASISNSNLGDVSYQIVFKNYPSLWKKIDVDGS